MHSTPFTVWVAVAALASAQSLVRSDYAPSDIIERDVAVIGGGASGTYGAVRLGDYGQSVVLIEKDNVLGGHCEGYSIPETGQMLDYGVDNFQNITVVRNFFAKFNLDLIPYTSYAKSSQYADFSTGTVYSNHSLPPPDFSTYINQLERFPYLDWGWDLPEPVPEELVLPFGQFIKKHSLEDIAYMLASFATGNGHSLDQTTAYILKSVDKAFIEAMQGGNVMSSSANWELYNRAQKHLGSDALVSSIVVASHRPDDGSKARLAVDTPSGRKLIIAKKILVAMPQTFQNMYYLGLDSHEHSIFNQFTNTALYVGLVKDTGVVPDYTNTLGVDLDNLYDIPSIPGIVQLQSTEVAGVYRFWYSAEASKTEKEVKADTLATIKRLTGKDATFMVFGNHTPYQLAVSPNAIRNGFYNGLTALQGHRNTWYTGSAFMAPHTAAV